MPDSPDDLAPAEFDLDAWIDGSKPTERSVTLVGRGDLVAEIEDVMRRYEVAEKIPDSDRGVNDDSPETLAARLEQLQAEMDATRSTWHLRAITSDEEKAARDAAEKAAGDGDPEFGAFLVALATTRVVSADGSIATTVTPEQVIRLRKRIGETQVLRLVAALWNATNKEPQIQAPFSRKSSGGPAGKA